MCNYFIGVYIARRHQGLEGRSLFVAVLCGACLPFLCKMGQDTIFDLFDLVAAVVGAIDECDGRGRDCGFGSQY